LLEPLSKDRVDFVRQGALLAQAMVLIQHNEAKEPKVKAVRKTFMDVHSLKGDTMTKFGAILAMGLIDAGGRNQTISLLSPAGHKKMAAIVGMALFPQFWYWYPYVHFISLAFTPTCVIGLQKQMKMPVNFACVSNAKPSQFAYPSPMEMKKVEEKKKLKTATLSVTAKAKARVIKRQSSTLGLNKADMDTNADDADTPANKTPKDSKLPAAKKDGDGDADMKGSTKDGKDTKDSSSSKDDDKDKKKDDKDKNDKDDKEKVKEKEKDEPNFETLKNPTRVTAAQQPLISYAKQRYLPVKKRLWGIVVLKDTTPEFAEDLVVPVVPKIGIPGIGDDEPEPPEPFEFTRA